MGRVVEVFLALIKIIKWKELFVGEPLSLFFDRYLSFFFDSVGKENRI